MGKRIDDTTIELAKEANLIEYMELNHPDCIVHRYGVRDANHNSLVLYPDSYCRYSTGEVNDNIAYLVNYQGYCFRDAVYCLKRFALSNYNTLSMGASYCHEKQKDTSFTFYKPPKRLYIDSIKWYLHNKRGLSYATINTMIKRQKLYATDISKYAGIYACFANTDLDFYSLRNIYDGMSQAKLLYSRSHNGFWFFTSLDFAEPADLFAYFRQTYNDLPANAPIYICESPIDALSLYELTKASGIYTAMCGLKVNTIENILDKFKVKAGSVWLPRRIILAVDNDSAGRQFVESHGKRYEAIFPKAKDWNEDLLKEQAAGS